ncbi:hypothetical protein [Polaribacter sp. Hel1_85]|uniref:hypothetical protein n=1 Tax=Polaribacter sp. Hel1_85 TaxID=1250005 RepID=UPI00052BE007|nr:hypothetical protein [Polaribacter sp. Hel1_85]KGL62252.1 hypothetical protein PHEL85_2043 [Polaribacter sp. Hel1_85]
MSQEDNLLGLLSSCWGGYYPTMDSIYHISSNKIIILTFLSILISIILHSFFRKKDFKISNNNQIEVIEVKEYSFVTKTVVIFFILILSSTPIFKFLNTGYFL